MKISIKLKLKKLIPNINNKKNNKKQKIWI